MKILNLFLLLLLTSCGFHQIVIPNLDIAAHRKVRKDLDLNRTQQKMLNEDIDITLNEVILGVKLYALPFVEQVNADNIAATVPKDLQYKVAHLYFHFEEKRSALMAKYLVQLDTKQLEHYFKVLEDENHDIRKRIKKYDLKIVSKRFKFFLGELNPEQEKHLPRIKKLLILRNKERLIRKEYLLLQLRKLTNMSSISQLGGKSRLQEKRQGKIVEEYSKFNQLTLAYFKSPETMKAILVVLDIIKLNNKKQKKHLAEKIKTAKTWTRYLVKHKF